MAPSPQFGPNACGLDPMPRVGVTPHVISLWAERQSSMGATQITEHKEAITKGWYWVQPDEKQLIYFFFFKKRLSHCCSSQLLLHTLRESAHILKKSPFVLQVVPHIYKFLLFCSASLKTSVFKDRLNMSLHLLWPLGKQPSSIWSELCYPSRICPVSICWFSFVTCLGIPRTCTPDIHMSTFIN